MTKKKKHIEPEKTEDSQVNEPSMAYVSTPGKNLAETFKTITVSTFEEQENDMRKYSLSLTPLQRMAYLYQLNQVAYAHVLSKQESFPGKKEIIIDSNFNYVP